MCPYTGTTLLALQPHLRDEYRDGRMPSWTSVSGPLPRIICGRYPAGYA